MKCINCETQFEGMFCPHCGCVAENMMGDEVSKYAEIDNAIVREVQRSIGIQVCGNCACEYNGIFCPNCGSTEIKSDNYTKEIVADSQELENILLENKCKTENSRKKTRKHIIVLGILSIVLSIIPAIGALAFVFASVVMCLTRKEESKVLAIIAILVSLFQIYYITHIFQGFILPNDFFIPFIPVIIAIYICMVISNIRMIKERTAMYLLMVILPVLVFILLLYAHKFIEFMHVLQIELNKPGCWGPKPEL